MSNLLLLMPASAYTPITFSDFPYDRPLPKSEFELNAIKKSTCNELLAGKTVLRKKWALEMLSKYWEIPALPASVTLQDLESYSMRVIEDETRPRFDNRLSFFIYQGDKIINLISGACWDPVSYQSDLPLQNLSAPNPITLNDEFLGTLSEEGREWILHTRELARLMNSRLAYAFQHQEIPNTPLGPQRFVEDLLRYRDLAKMLNGEEPITTLWPYFELFGPDGDLLDRALGGRLDYFSKDGQIIHKVHFDHPMSLKQMSTIATSVLMLSTRANKIYTDDRIHDSYVTKIYANSVSVTDPTQHIHVHHLNLKTMAEAVARGEKVDPRYLNANEDLIQYVKSLYAKDESYTAAQRIAQENFSRKYVDRMEYLFLTDESASPPDGHQNQNHFTMEGSFGMVMSDSPDLPLSDEVIYGVPAFDRSSHQNIGNMIRFGVDERYRPFLPKLLFETSSYLLNIRYADLIVLITHEDYAHQLMKDFGFSPYIKIPSISGDLWELQIKPANYIRTSLNQITGGASLPVRDYLFRPSYIKNQVTTRYRIGSHNITLMSYEERVRHEENRKQ